MNSITKKETQKIQQSSFFWETDTRHIDTDTDLEPEPISLTATSWEDIKSNLRRVVPEL
jgi:nitrate/TMAO reductase-like tetraheme cytochrome c subunit